MYQHVLHHVSLTTCKYTYIHILTYNPQCIERLHHTQTNASNTDTRGPTPNITHESVFNK
jgi:hypothetical protein